MGDEKWHTYRNEGTDDPGKWNNGHDRWYGENEGWKFHDAEKWQFNKHDGQNDAYEDEKINETFHEKRHDKITMSLVHF